MTTPKKTVGKERLLRKTSLGAQYVTTDYNGKNEAGWQPIGDSVLVMCDKPVTKTAGGILLSETTQESHRAAAESGVVVAVGGGAFEWTGDRTQKYTGYKPKPGDHVAFTRYAGQLLIGKDGIEYRLMTDNCIGGVDLDDTAPAISGPGRKTIKKGGR